MSPQNPNNRPPGPQPYFPFSRTDHVATAELIGARWWQERLVASANPLARRAALITLGATASLLVVGGLIVRAAKPSSGGVPSDLVESARKSLDAQKELGWNVGAGTADLTFEGATTEALEPGVLDRLEGELAPTNRSLAPYYVPTLFQSLNALPTGTPIASDPMKRIRDAIKPIRTSAMTRAEEQGLALASLFDNAPAGRAVIVDLPGPEAVAFATGLANKLDVVFGFDGWPHPQGVVPSHLTLAAAASSLNALSKAKAARPEKSPPAFILDRARLLPYASDSDRFDNRYTAKLPTAANFALLGVKQILYVSRGGAVEADDLNDDFVAYKAAGIEIRRLDPDDFSEGVAGAPTTVTPGSLVRNSDAGRSGSTGSYSDSTYRNGYYSNQHYYWGGSPSYHYFFWPHYGWGRPSYSYSTPRSTSILRSTYTPTPRSTVFSGRTRPSTFGRVNLYSSPSSGGKTTGTSRSGSWTRSNSTSTGSGS